MHRLYEVKDRLIEEIGEYADKSQLTREDVELIKCMSSAADHIGNISERHSYDDGMSHRGYSRNDYSSRDGYSNRRDSMGRYSRSDVDFKKKLEEIMRESPNDSTRQRMQSLLNEM